MRPSYKSKAITLIIGYVGYKMSLSSLFHLWGGVITWPCGLHTKLYFWKEPKEVARPLWLCSMVWPAFLNHNWGLCTVHLHPMHQFLGLPNQKEKRGPSTARDQRAITWVNVRRSARLVAPTSRLGSSRSTISHHILKSILLVGFNMNFFVIYAFQYFFNKFSSMDIYYTNLCKKYLLKHCIILVSGSYNSPLPTLQPF